MLVFESVYLTTMEMDLRIVCQPFFRGHFLCNQIPKANYRMSKTMKYEKYSPKESLGNVKINETINVGGVSKGTIQFRFAHIFSNPKCSMYGTFTYV